MASSSIEVNAFAAELLNLPAPPTQRYEDLLAEGKLSVMMQEFYSTNRRVSNAKLKRVFGPMLFPDFRAGLRHEYEVLEMSMKTKEKNIKTSSTEGQDEEDGTKTKTKNSTEQDDEKDRDSGNKGTEKGQKEEQKWRSTNKGNVAGETMNRSAKNNIKVLESSSAIIKQNKSEERRNGEEGEKNRNEGYYRESAP